jgi:phosphoribosylformimino-5-aminoimidazole carboxamide ribotide isomerase
MVGADLERFAQLVQRSPHPLLASGGIAGPEDLAALARAGAAGAVLGMALYTGALDPRAIARDYHS